LLRILVPFSTIAAAVSSHDVSIPRMSMKRLYANEGNWTNWN
jgi:hypothetical protein